MSKVWRRLQRVGKKATKFKINTFSHVLTVNCNSKWQPDKICLIWSHRNRKYQSKFSKWEPGLKNVYEGVVEWDKSTDQIEFDITFYKSINEDSYEEKEWILMVESEDSKGKKRLLATGKFNMDKYVNIEPFYQTEIKDFKLKPSSEKIKSCSISFLIACQFLKDGKATDEDMISVASFMSSASSTNPYLNSNYIFDQKYNDFDYENEENEYKNKNTLKPPNYNNKNRINRNSNNSSELEEYLDEENENEDIDSYFSKQNLNRIEYNFNNFTNNTSIKQNQTIMTSTNNKKENIKPTPIIKSANTTITSSSSSFNSTIIKVPSINKLPNLVSHQVKVDDLNPFEDSTNNDTEFNNPFVDDEKMVNSCEKNPFLQVDEEETNNPFLENENEKTNFSIELDSNSNYEIKNHSNNKLLNTSNTSKDLLDWCKDIIHLSKTSSVLFENLQVNDFSTSWNNGLAFCAIIHHFRPKLIDLKKLSDKEPKINLKQAFSATDKESIVRVIDYSDILNKKSLDQLSIMTYLYQIRDCYDSQTSKTKNLIPKSKTISSIDNKLSNLVSLAAREPNKENQTKTLNRAEKATKNTFFNPFDSDDNEETNKDLTLKNADLSNNSKCENNKKSSGLIEIKPNGQIIDAIESNQTNENKQTLKQNLKKNKSIEKEEQNKTEIKQINSSEDLIQKAKILIEKSKTSLDQNLDDTRKEEIKQKAKQMIAETKKLSRRKSSTSSGNSISKKDLNESNRQILISEEHESNEELLGAEYINQEIINLKQKQKELDEKGNYIETQLRSIMKKNSSNDSKNNKKISNKDKELEDKFLRDWFLLINEKNALLHQQQELEILQNEKSLEKRYEMLSNQLRYLMQIDEFYKTDEQKKTETILFNELISLVNKRNELVIQLDQENKLLTEGEEINEFIQNKTSFQPKEKQCLIQ